MSEDTKDKESKEEIIVNDRRLLTEEERRGVSDPPDEPTSEPTGTSDETEEEKDESQIPPTDLDVKSLCQVFIGEFSARAWIHMGLIQNPVTKLVVKDLAQARLAIDGVAALVEKLEPHLEDRERRQYQTLLNDLRMNYVQHSG